jgi:atlastin
MNERGTSSSEAEAANSFAWRGGQERQTTGIWMWSEPFLRTPKGSSEQVAVLLMDTQGMFDNETSMSLTAQIFGLSTFVSSFQVNLILPSIRYLSYHFVFSLYIFILSTLQIYNVERRIQEDNLQHLALFAEYGRMAAAPNVSAIIHYLQFSLLLVYNVVFNSIRSK